MDVELAGLVLLVETAVLLLVFGGVDHRGVDQEPAPEVVAVAGEQGVVEVEQGQVHDVPGWMWRGAAYDTPRQSPSRALPLAEGL